MGLLSPKSPNPAPWKFSGGGEAKPIAHEAITTPAFKPCDQCGYAFDGQPISRAKYRVSFSSGELYFCNHHFNRYSLSFMAHNCPAILIDK